MTRKTFAILLCITLALTACGQAPPAELEPVQDTEPYTEQPVAAEVEEEPPQRSDKFHPIVGGDSHITLWAWLHGGSILAVRDHGNIRYLDLYNRLIGEVNIPEHMLVGNYRISLYDNRIFVANGNGARRRPDNPDQRPGDFTVVQVDGEWILTNGSIWDGEGNLIREFVHHDHILDAFSNRRGSILSDGRQSQMRLSMWEWGIGPPTWINEDLVAIQFSERLFFYRISTDTVTLAADLSEWFRTANLIHMHVFYGIGYIMPAENGVFYFARDDEVEVNFGTVWFADETGAQQLFDGQRFSSMRYHNGMLLMVDEGQNFNDGIKLWYATSDDWTLRELAYWDHWHNSQRAGNGFFSFVEGWRRDFRAIDTASAAIITVYTPPIENANFSILGIREVEGSLQFIYSVQISGPQLYFYIYDQGSGITRELDRRLYTQSNGLNEPRTHFVELYPSGWRVWAWEASGIRVREIK